MNIKTFMKKRWRAITCCAVLFCIAAIGMIFATPIWGMDDTSARALPESGTSSDPYIIYSAEDWGAALAKTGDDIIYVKLGADIVATNGYFVASNTNATYDGPSPADPTKGALYVPADKKVSLDLNNHKIDRGLTNSAAVEYGSVIISEGYLEINGKATLDDKNGARSADNQTVANRTTYQTVTGVTVTGGMITGGNNKTTSYAAGLSVRKGTTVMNGGAICNNKITAPGVGFEATGVGVNVGTINVDSINYTPDSFAKFILNDGLICLNTGYASSPDGGGIGATHDGQLEMYGGDVSWNSIYYVDQNWGGGIATRKASTIAGGKIRHNYCQGRGGGLAPHASTLVMSDVEVSDNIAGAEAAIYLRGTALSLTNVTIAGNRSLNNATYQSPDAISTNATADNPAKLILSGKIVLQDNMRTDTNAKVSFKLKSGQVIYITGKISDDSDIYVEMADPDGGIFTNGFRANSEGTNFEVFKSNLTGLLVTTTADNQELMIRKANGPADYWNEKVRSSITNKQTTTFDELTTQNWTSTSANGSMGGGIGFGPKPLSGAATGYDNLRVPEGASINFVMGAGRVLSRNLNGNGVDDGYVIKVFGELTISGGGTISGGRSKANGGGIYVANGGRLTITDVTITSCKADNFGGGIYVEAGGTVIIGSAVIKGNTAGVDGGGVYLQNGGSLTLRNSPAIMENKTTRNYFDNLFIEDDTYINVENNIGAFASTSYIGVSLENSIGKFSNATNLTDITRFVADRYFNEQNKSSTYYAVSKADNRLAVIQKENVSIADKWNLVIQTSLDKNVSVRFDLIGDWAADESGSFGSGVGFKDGQICVPQGAQVLFYYTDSFTVNRNLQEAELQTSGSVFVVRGSIFFEGDGTITGGNALNGGGIYVGANGAVTLEQGTVTGNTAQLGGGIYVEAGGVLNLHGCNITQNSADGGAGIYLNNSGISSMKGKVVAYDNFAGTEQSNITFTSNKKISFSGKLDDGSKMGVGYLPRNAEIALVFTQNYYTHNSDNVFTADDLDHIIRREGNEVIYFYRLGEIAKPEISDAAIENNAAGNAISVVVVYNGTPQDTVSLVAEECQNLTLSYDTGFNGGVFAVEQVGNYTITATPKDGYIWKKEQGGGNHTITINIEVRELQTSAIEWYVDGGQTNEVVYNGEVRRVTAFAVDVSGKKMNITSSLGGDTAKTDCGESYSVALSQTPENVILSDGIETSFVWSITKAEAELKFFVNGEEVTESVYTGANQIVTAKVILGNKEFDAVVTDIEAKNVGDYTSVVDEESITNFIITNSKSVDWSIICKELQFEWLIDGKANATESVYNGTVQYITVNLIGVANGDDVNVVLSGGSGRDIGDYSTTIISLDGADKANYTIDNATFDWEITKKSVSITWFVDGEEFDEAKFDENNVYRTVFDGQFHSVEPRIDCLDGESVSVVYDGGYYEINTGDYTVTATGLTGYDAANYNLIIGEGGEKFDWVIGKAKLTATIKTVDKTVAYTGNSVALIKWFEIKLDGLVGVDEGKKMDAVFNVDESMLTPVFYKDGSAVDAKEEGTYQIRFSTVKDNYEGLLTGGDRYEVTFAVDANYGNLTIVAPVGGKLQIDADSKYKFMLLETTDSGYRYLSVYEEKNLIHGIDDEKFEKVVIGQVAHNTSISDFINNFVKEQRFDLRIYNSQDVLVYDCGTAAGGINPSDAKSLAVGTGWRVELISGGKAVDKAYISVLGDVNGDGYLSAVDASKIYSLILGEFKIDGFTLEAEMACYISNSGYLSAIDAAKLYSVILGEIDIEEFYSMVTGNQG